MKLNIKKIFFVALLVIFAVNVVLPCFNNFVLAANGTYNNEDGTIDINKMLMDILFNQAKKSDLIDDTDATIIDNDREGLRVYIPNEIMQEYKITLGTEYTESGQIAIGNTKYALSLSHELPTGEKYVAELVASYYFGDSDNKILLKFTSGYIEFENENEKTLLECKLTDYEYKDGKIIIHYQRKEKEKGGLFNMFDVWTDGEFTLSADDELITAVNNGVFESERLEYLENYGYFNFETEEANVDPIEKLMALMFNAIANGLNSVISSVFNEPVTMDKLIFNGCDETQITFFGNSGGSSSSIISTLSTTINKWYSIFRKIAIVVYMVLLVYMGVRIMLSSTGKNLAMYKSLFMYWCIGVALLFLYPYVMRYSIELNNAFVQEIESSKTSIFGGESEGVGTTQGQKVDNILVIDFDKDPFASSGAQDYMSAIASRANSSKRLALAVTYIILTWQLITMIVYYYKRVFTVALLIAIFPLVAASFVIDRIADGKSQAFNKWNKEFLINVFIQTFHAIVYVFVCGTVSATMAGSTIDYILIITGVTFMFTGEDIIKKIFSQSPSSTAKSLKDTAANTAKVVAAVETTKKVVSGATKPFIGKDSVANRMKNVSNERKALEMADDNFDSNATPQQNPHSGEGFDNLQEVFDDIDADTTLTSADKILAKREAKELAKNIDVFNNPQDASAEQLSKAYNGIKSAMQNDPNNKLLNNVKLSPTQMTSMVAIGATAASMMASGVDNKTIERDITQKLSVTFEGLDEESKQKYANAFMQNMATYGASRGYTTSETEEYASDMLSEITRMSNSFNYYTGATSDLSDADIERAEKEREKYVDDVLDEAERSINQHIREYKAVETEYSKLDASDDATDEEKKQRKEQLDGFRDAIDEFDNNRQALAESLAVFWGRSTGAYSAEEQLRAIENIQVLTEENIFAQETVDKLGLSGEEIDAYAHILSAKVSEDENVSDEAKTLAQEMLEDYEGDDVDLRDGYEDVDFSYHEAIKNSRNSTEYYNMTQRINVARSRANQSDRDATRKFAEDVINDRGIDVDEGNFDDTTMYYDGKTKAEVHQEYEDISKHRTFAEVLRRDFKYNTNKKG